jgi:porin
MLNTKHHRLLIAVFCACFMGTVHATSSIKSDNLPEYSNQSTTAISSNPAAVNSVTGTGALQDYIQRKLGIQNNHGIRIGGTWLGDANNLFSGGIQNPKRWTYNSSFLLGLNIDTEKMLGWNGGLFGAEFLHFNAQKTNEQAGSVQGYNSLPGPPPLSRSELYQLWFRQTFFDKKFIIKIGKMVTTQDFGNVSKPVALTNENLMIPAVSGLIYTPLFLNSSMLGIIPGYYNSSYGLLLSFAPVKSWYFNYGVYDGNLAQQKQTGLKETPTWNGSYFHIAETGLAWLLGNHQLPGDFAVGVWRQNGLILGSPGLSENGATGSYLFGTQRLWYKNPGVDTAGISSFYQYGLNNSGVLPVKKFVGAGLTAFGLLFHRPADSMGVGVALSWLNQNTFTRPTELMYQAYYQAKVIDGIYLEPVISYIPTPGASSTLSPAWAGTMRVIVLF